jgi:hypothetical protein
LLTDVLNQARAMNSDGLARWMHRYKLTDHSVARVWRGTEAGRLPIASNQPPHHVSVKPEALVTEKADIGRARGSAVHANRCRSGKFFHVEERHAPAVWWHLNSAHPLHGVATQLDVILEREHVAPEGLQRKEHRP